jgi:hypothetical protein|tara:strand:+ start:595 stop:756 length:162 start_codon:yes stop_codon:yes gene_type:complete
VVGLYNEPPARASIQKQALDTPSGTVFELLFGSLFDFLFSVTQEVEINIINKK